MNSESIAHVTEDGRVHFLDEHLRETARLAGEFAAVFGCREWGRLAGLWHDLGKYSDEFQRYIRAVNDPDVHVGKKGGDHSTTGALLAIEKFSKKGWPLAFAIAGHHAGLADIMT